MKWLKGFAGCLAILLLAAGCSVVSDKDNAAGGLSRSKVTLKLPSGVSLKPNGQLFSGGNGKFAAQITSIDLTISASDMVTVTQNIPLATMETTLDVPSGLARTFQIAVLTDTGLNFTGSQTVDLTAGAVIDVIISVDVAGVAPTSVTATAGAGQVTLKWNPVIDATSYNVYYGKATGVTAANGTKVAGATSGSAITGLTSGTKYYFVVTAVNAAGESVPSAEVSATTDINVPTGVGATAGNGQVAVSWSAVTGAVSYNVYYGTATGVTAANGTKVAGATSGSAITGLTNGTTYYFVVTAVSAGGEGAASSEVSATPQVPAPSAPTGVGAVLGSGQVTISWKAVAGATSYNVYYSNYSGVTTTTQTVVISGSTTTTITSTKVAATSGSAITGLTNGTAYYFIVTAVNAGGESAASSEVSATPQVSAPGTPSGVSAVIGSGQVSTSWNAVTGATSYNVYYGTATGVTTANGTKVTGATSGSAITGLTNGTTYYFIVTAVNAGGESAASSEVSATPQITVPSAPTGVSATPGKSQVSVSWTTPANATSSNVYYGTTTGVTIATGTKITSATSGSAITGLTNGTTYYFIVTGVNAGGESAASPEVSAVAGGDYWTTKTSMPTSRGSLAAVAVNEVIYAIGGWQTQLTTVEAYTPTTDIWVTKTAMPTARYYFSASPLDGNIYAVGGYTGAGGITYAIVEAYNTVTDTWSTKTSLTTARYGLTTAAVNGKIYAIGGTSATPADLSSVEMYDPAANTWVTKAAMPTARSFTASAVVNGIIYVIGGSTGGSPLPTVEAYNPITDTWTTKATMPTSRKNFAASVIDGVIYCIGGDAPSTTVEAYNPATNTWSTKVSMPTARGYLAAATVDGKIYAIGGASSPTLATVEAYNPAVNASSNTWVYKSSMITARQELALCALNGKIYAIGGWVNPTYLSSMEEYDTATGTWTNCGTAAPGNGCASMATPRAGAVCVATGGKIHVMGGYTSTPAYLASAETYDPATNTWTTMTYNMSAARYHPASAEFNGKAFVMGGTPDGTAYATTVDIFNYTLLPISQWTTGTTFTTGRYMAGAESYGGKIYLMGGNNTTNLLDIQKYDPVAATWTSAGNMPLALYGFGIANLNGLFYISGGTDGVGKSASYSYNPATGTWTTLASMGTTRWYHKSVAVNGKVYVVGGAESGAPATSMLEYTP